MKYRFENHTEQNSEKAGMLSFVGSAFALLAAGLTLWGISKTCDDNERQRQHERDMVSLAQTNPNITVQTGPVVHEHYHHGAGYNSNDESRMTRAGMRAISGSRN